MKFKEEISAGGIVYKKDSGKTFWLVTQHSKNHNWSFPKGLIGDKTRNEKPQDAALREVEEEGGVKSKIIVDQPFDIHYMFRFQGYLIKKTVYYFLMEYLSGDPQDHDWEMSEAKFMETEEVKKILSYESEKDLFEKIMDLVKI